MISPSCARFSGKIARRKFLFSRDIELAISKKAFLANSQASARCQNTRVHRLEINYSENQWRYNLHI